MAAEACCILLGPADASTGNSVTLTRLAALLSRSGHPPPLLINALSPDAPQQLAAALPAARLLLALHGVKAGRLLLPHYASPPSAAPPPPLVLVLAGTDVNAPSQPGTVCATAESAVAVVGFGAHLLEALHALLRAASAPPPRATCIIPQAVTQPQPAPLAPCVRAALGLHPATPLAILVAGLREVKDPLFIVPAFAAWRERLAGRRGSGEGEAAHLPALLIVGPPLEPSVCAAVRACAGVGTEGSGAAAPFGGMCGVFLHPPVSNATLLAWVSQADAALNTSHSEGQCAAVLEAMAAGTPVVARACKGNAAVVAHGATGLLFFTAERAVRALEAVMGGLGEGGGGCSAALAIAGRERPLRTACGAALAVAARAYVTAHHSVEGEEEAWLALLARCAAPPPVQPQPQPQPQCYVPHALLALPAAQRTASALVVAGLRWLGVFAPKSFGPVVRPPLASPSLAAAFAQGRVRYWGAPGDEDDLRWPCAPFLHDFTAPSSAASASTRDKDAAALLLLPPPHLHGPAGEPWARLGWGRYAEDRSIYTSAHFSLGEAAKARTFHIGVDLEAAAGTPVLAPLAGKVHSIGWDESELGYGPTVILEHVLRLRLASGECAMACFYTLYGHLSRNSVFDSSGTPRLAKGAEVQKGGLVGEMGSPVGGENGGWWPHVHFQIMTEAGCGGWQGDYPGVCRRGDWGAYSELMVDPNVILRCPWVEPVGWWGGGWEGEVKVESAEVEGGC